MTRLLLIDDHPLFCGGFVASCGALRKGFAVTVAETAGEARRTLREQPGFDCILIDILLPDADGLEAMQELARIDPLVPRVVISSRDDRAVRLRAQSLGASGFVSKTAQPAAIMQTLDRILAGEICFEEDAGDETAHDGPLRARQLEVLKLLAEGCANKDIENRLNLAGRTVRAHLTTIFKALGVKGRARAVLEARRQGLIS
ncbi:response regulator transcription factor [Asticcacaulis solisilvae]|uniref:response regulator transcription factor n=1 Tax=Asticcacaulis solisilvae TaxID=1217274 RepID=UPI003FD7EFBD